MVIKDTGFNVNRFSNIVPTANAASVGKCGKIAAADDSSQVLRSRTDTIQISAPHRTDSDHSVLKETRDKIMSDINRETPDDSLKALKESVDSGSYTPDVDELTRILLR